MSRYTNDRSNLFVPDELPLPQECCIVCRHFTTYNDEFQEKHPLVRGLGHCEEDSKIIRDQHSDPVNAPPEVRISWWCHAFEHIE